MSEQRTNAIAVAYAHTPDGDDTSFGERYAYFHTWLAAEKRKWQAEALREAARSIEWWWSHSVTGDASVMAGWIDSLAAQIESEEA